MFHNVNTYSFKLDAKVMLFQGLKRVDVPDLYRTAKVTIDCRNPGVEFINYEAVMYDCLTLSCDSRATPETNSIFQFSTNI